MQGIKSMFKGPDDTPVQQASSRVDEQTEVEKRRLAEETSDLKKKQALMKRGGAGRSLLIKTSPTGAGGAGGGVGNLGGTE